MSDPIEIISISSTPPGSPLFELPTTFKKVSEMCVDLDKSEDSVKEEEEESRESPGMIKNVRYHSLSDSDSEEQLNTIRPIQLEDQLMNNENLTAEINTYSPPKPTNNGRKPKVTESVAERRRLEKELKAKEKAEKAKEKAERAALLEKIRQSKPDQCIKNITVILDEGIVSSNIGKKAVDLFKDVEFGYEVEKQRDPFSVTWTRKEPGLNSSVTEEKHILFIWSYEKLSTSVKYCTLIDTFRELKNKYNEFRIYLAIYGFGEYCRKMSRKSVEVAINGGEERVYKRRRTLEIPRNQVDTILCELEVLLKVCTRFLKNHHELSALLQQITKAIAETPHRKEIEKRDLEKCWYARGDSRDCVKVDKDLNGLYRLWLQQLSQFNKSSLDSAKSIAEIYPSPFTLYQAYQKLSTQKEKELLLQDIQIKKGGSSTRRIGPELSRKISLLFSQENGEIFLSQE